MFKNNFCVLSKKFRNASKDAADHFAPEGFTRKILKYKKGS